MTRGVDDRPIGIHRTFLARDGSGKAPVEPAKMMLGPCRGGAVRLGAPSNFLMVGEGIETCLAAMQATGHPAWAALSTSGLRSLEPPDHINEVVVLADGDEPPLLNGIASAPLLREDGTIFCAQGYDAPSGMWLENVPDLADAIPDHPTRRQAQAGLDLLRETFKTFCFADAASDFEAATGLTVVDTNRPPGRDESAFLVGLLTAVCRPSLHLAPGVLLRAAPLSGAGAGKGLLARCISMIAFGHEPYAVTGGGNAEELEKRIASELIAGGSALYLDNMNNTALKSDLLASAITERPARVRVLGRSQMVPLNASAFIILTGNGLTVSEDLARRFIAVEFDPGTEDPELRPFTIDIRAVVKAKRQELLSALLTIWRWGRLECVPAGKTLGSFEQWSRWVRDPLLALGCQDPVERISEAKERDSRRQSVSDLFSAWWACHQEKPVAIRDLAERVKEVADPQGRGRQYLAAHLERLAGTRAAGFILTRQAPVGTWGAATFSLRRAEDHRGHRGHRGSLDAHGAGNGHMEGPMPPMPPMPSSSPATNGAEEPDHRRSWSTRL